LQGKAPSVREKRIGSTLPYLALTMAIAILLVMFAPSRPFPFLTFLHVNFGFAVPVVLLLFGLARYETMLGRLLSCNWMVSCGDASYSIYLLHGLIIADAGLSILPVGETSSVTAIVLVRLVVVVIVIIGFSMVTYRIAEDPARRFLRRLLTIKLKQPSGKLNPTFV